ncbi:peptidase M50 [Myxococcota bacterium]|nr:peptidase M50 [Myxococcota bacterium]
MSESLLSASWYRAAGLRPRLRSHVRLHRHEYRGQLWYVLRDEASQSCHRLSSTAHRLIGWMNGERTCQAIWDLSVDEMGDDAPSQDELIRLLGVLHTADALASDVSPDLLEIFRRQKRRESGEFWGRIANPLALRLGRVDPDEFLTRWEPLVRPLFTWVAMVCYAAIVGTAGVLAMAHSTELTAGAMDALLAPHNLLMLVIVYPFMKLIHELGHAFAAKTWGCQVREIGLLFLVLMPMPYVDASAISVIPEKGRRMAVGAAGIVVELVMAALAFFVWLNVEPGLVRAIAYDIMWIGGVSTLLFNGNPLLKFDAYYVLSDWLEIPNLGQRSQQYVKYVLDRRIFGLEGVRDPVHARGERPWLLFYGITSFAYRQLVVLGIALFVAGQFFVLGVALALLSLFTQIVLPLLRGMGSLLTHPRFGNRRLRAVSLTALALAFVAGFVLRVPIPHWTVAEGVIWPPERAHVRAGADGFVTRVDIEPSSVVAPGEVLLITRDPLLETQLRSLKAKLRELGARHHAQRRVDLVQAQVTYEEIVTTRAELARAREVAGEVVIRSPSAGRFVPVGDQDWTGRFVRKGELVGYITGPEATTVRVAISEDDVAMVRAQTHGVEMRSSSRPGEMSLASIAREVPAASDRLPSATLGVSGGGLWPVDPGDPEGVQSLLPVFQFDLALGPQAHFTRIGERVHVRFDHGREPLAARLGRSLRRLFLGKFGV